MKAIDLFYNLDNMTEEEVSICITDMKKSTLKQIVKFYENGFRDLMKWNPQLKEMKFRIKGKMDILRTTINYMEAKQA